MSSIARSLKAVRPAVLSKALPARTTVWAASRRTFSTSPIALEKRYTKDHEWIDINHQKQTGIVGISEYAAEQLGDVVYVELPEPNGWVEKGDAIGAVESVKSASDINSPIRCRITQVNTALEEKPSIINQVPEDDSAGGGWLAKVEIDEAGLKEFETLMDTEAYVAYTKEEEEE
ncbi:probable GCV3 - glycine decarboxylase, subunit H [Cephalotrichum gorgonifer]|uniref:Glycine cleavage system H protein n=1 Tax=Cephalotrichum gorgonifer TaxID=2041049 RepID=A0AAE8SZE7_9PEZI|nr:probable GCV3 - glycine decarboxylase, subunit H [Cephalotrichum gorgonifer]